MIVGPYYLLYVALATAPTQEAAWRVEGGWDSCMLMEVMVKRYSKEPLVTRCVAMDARGELKAK